MNYMLRILERDRNIIRKCLSTEASKPEKSNKTEGPILIAAHVGSGFCRAAAVCSKGKVLHFADASCKVYQYGIFNEMSSDSIWKNLIKCIRAVAEKINLGQVQGIGFTAIPALVCVDQAGNPVTASTSRDPNINVILHYDQRSKLESQKINSTRHALLRYFGERVMPRMQESKLMWIKGNLKEDCWDRAGHFFELSDFLTWKATGSLIRSSSTLVSQWSYEIAVNGKEGWDAEYFKEIGIPELADDNFKKLGSEIQRPGTPIAEGLQETVAKEMGLIPKLPVATSMTDGYSGCLGLIGCNFKGVADDFSNRLCIVFGTRAASHFIMSREPHFVKGVNGPFRDSVLPYMWLNHAGQTTAESVLEYIIDTHTATPEIKKQIGQMHIHKYLNKILKLKAAKQKLPARSYLTKHLHILPDFEGNKSPLADPWIRGMISGLSISTGQESLAVLYLAAMQSLAYSTRHIISALTQQGHDIRCLIIGGLLGKNSLFTILHKDVCQVPTVSPNEPKSKLLGAAILAAMASSIYRDFNQATQEMCGWGQVILPDKGTELIDFHEKKYQIFLKMYDHQMEYRRIMSGGTQDSKELNAKQ